METYHQSYLPEWVIYAVDLEGRNKDQGDWCSFGSINPKELNIGE